MDLWRPSSSGRGTGVAYVRPLDGSFSPCTTAAFPHSADEVSSIFQRQLKHVRRRPRTAMALAVGMAAVLTWTTVNTGMASDAPKDTPQSAQGQAAKSGSKAVVFEDNFDGAAGSGVNEERWQIETGDNPSNQERQWYTAGDNAKLDGNGNLVITARKENPGNYQCWYGPCEYTSSRLNTSGKFKQQYGHVEARMKVPRGQGMWPAFWALGNDFDQVGWPDSGEIDIMENVGKEPDTVHGTLHGPGYSGGEGIGEKYSLPNGEAFADKFHTFAIDWSPDKIVWSVDGNEFQTRTPADLGGKSWAFNKEFFLILNLAVGGAWPGDPDGGTEFPQELVVDYVRVTA